MIGTELTALGVRFYDVVREHYPDHDARHVAVCYMRRKDPDGGGNDSMPFYEALADALAIRAAEKIERLRRKSAARRKEYA